MSLTKRLLTFAAAAGLAAGGALFVTGSVRLDAQNRMRFPITADDGGHVALGLAIRKLSVSGTYMQCPAHPDDETNALFALYGYGAGLRVIDVQNNRGEGGQNEIGPELFRDIGVLRTSELLSAHRIDGAEQYFTRAIDYGYSFDPQEVIEKWGRDEIVGDYVRLIRTLRPEVVLTMNIQGGGGDRAHEATTILAREAFRAAGDPTKYPEQIREGLRPWQASKLYFAGGGGAGGRGGRGGPGGAGRGAAAPAGARGAAAPPADAPAPGAAPPAATSVARVDTAAFDQLLGRTYAEIGSDARTNHKCQGTGTGLPALPGIGGGGRGGGGGAPGGPGGGPGAAPGGAGGGGQAGGAMFTLVDTTIPGQMGKDETSLFDGVDLTIAGIAKYAGSGPPAALTSGLTEIANQALRAKQAFESGNDAATAAPIEAGLTAVRTLRAQLASMGLSDTARYEIDFRLKNKEQDYQAAVIVAHGLTFQAVADDGLVVAGQPVRVSLGGINRGATDVSVTSVDMAGFDNPAPCPAAPIARNGVFSCSGAATIPKNAKLTDPYFTDTYWKTPSNPARNDFDPNVPFGVPFAPTPFRVVFHIKAGTVDVTKELPIEYRYVKDLYFGDKQMELNVVPAFSARVMPVLAVVPARTGAAATASTPRELVVAVTNGARAATKATVALSLPAGWKATPATTEVAFDKEDEARTVRFTVSVPAQTKSGAYPVKAVITSPATGDEQFSVGYQEIDYPHVQRRQVIKAAETTFKVIDVKAAPNLKVGYVVGVGDQVPPAIEQLGAKVTFIDTNELAWGDLSKYDVIMTGVRAYERRDDLRAYNSRLLDYATRGGTVVVQYNKMEFNQAQYGPYPAQVSSNRVTDENAPVKLLVPAHPMFNFPNEIGAMTWANWTQERGLYFIGQKDPKYVDLISMTDSFADNPGEKLGSLIEARVGKGRWLYVGLGLWRQLPAGTDGAYQLLANLISLPKAPEGPKK
jgi:GlcNAc-PI de-N-acetylase/NPCBM-associated, NEW3 domain of alpha-galactosidase